MNHPKPNITVNVDVTNPGQFFACCGLLELADRLWPGAEVMGGFISPRFQRSQFNIWSKHSLDTQTIVTCLCRSQRNAVEPLQAIKKDGKVVKDVSKIKPIQLTIERDDGAVNEPVSMRLNWWLDELTGQQQDHFKLWSAHVSSQSLIADMANAIHPEKINDETVFEYSCPMTGRIGLDARSSWNTLDEGFSPNNQGLKVESFPAAELLAAIGLQYFIPLEGDGFAYVCWNRPLPTVVARAAVAGCVGLSGASWYRFQVAARGRFKYFTKASPYERNNND